MPLIRMQVGISADSVLPRDQAVNTLYFSHNNLSGTGGPNYEQLCTDLANVYHNGWMNQAPYQITVRAYNADVLYNAAGGDTGPPEFVHVKNPGQAGPAPFPREVAVCLSYYAVVNRPGKRGRVFLPMFAATQGRGELSGRPNTAILNAARDMAVGFSNLGGANVDWLLYSPKARATYKITQAWVDNEWDTQRSRGLRATTRVTQAIDE